MRAQFLLIQRPKLGLRAIKAKETHFSSFDAFDRVNAKLV
jgi:hypothetical protein